MTLANHITSRHSLIAGFSGWYLKADDISFRIAEKAELDLWDGMTNDGPGSAKPTTLRLGCQRKRSGVLS